MPYQEITMIELKDWTVLHSVQKLDDFFSWLKKWSDFIKVWDVIFNKYEIRKAFKKNPNDIEAHILSLPTDHKKIIDERTIKMKELWKRRENTDQVDRFIQSKLEKQGDTVEHLYL